MSLKRIQKELRNMANEDLENISAGPVTDNIYKWQATIMGPEGTPYEGGIFFFRYSLEHYSEPLF